MCGFGSFVKSRLSDRKWVCACMYAVNDDACWADPHCACGRVERVCATWVALLAQVSQPVSQSVLYYRKYVFGIR